MKFVKVTESERLELKNTSKSDIDYALGILYLSRLYVVDHPERGLARVADGEGDILLLDVSKKTFGIEGFGIPCTLSPEASEEEIRNIISIFNTAYGSRN